MTKQIGFEKYAEFVDAVTSDESKDFVSLADRLVALDSKGANIERLMTGAIGINAESGEFLEIVKKMVFQGKPYSEDNIFHMKRELSDLLWYFTQCCIALDTNIDEIMEINIDKLKKRFPNGGFESWYSENRQLGDV